MLNWNEIVGIVEQRRRQDSDMKRRMIEVRDRFNGDYVIPLPDSKGEPNMPALMPNLVADGIEITALRAAAVDPMIIAPALDQNKATGVRSVALAEDRRRAWSASWHYSHMTLLRRRLFRQLGGYGSMNMVVVPEFADTRGRFETRDSLSAYPDERDPDDIRIPENVAYVYGRSASAILKEHWDHLDARMVQALQQSRHSDEMWNVVEWIDADQIALGIAGPRDRHRYTSRNSGASSDEIPNQMLRRWKNRVGRCTAVVSERVTLDRVAGQLDTMLPNYDLANRIMALEVDAMERSIYPDRYVISDDNREPLLVSGEWKDGREGGMNRIANARAIGYLQSQPSQMTNVVLDRIESGIRQSAGVNAMASGLTPGSLRTGRALDSFQGFSLEPRIIEMDDIMARACTLGNELVADVEKAYFPNKTIFAFSGDPTDQGILEYKPAEVWETNLNAVVYPLPGADLNNMTLAAGQMIGARIGSRRDAMAMHPGVKDPDRSNREMIVEGIDDALLQGFQQQLAGGQLTLAVAAKVKRKVSAGVPLETAIEEADQEVREMQAREAEAASEAQPGMAPGAPDMAQPPAPAPAEMEAQIGANPEQAGFRELMNALQATAPRSAGGNVRQ